MTGTIRWFRGLTRSDPMEVAEKTRRLLREGPAVAMELEDLCMDGLDRLLDRTDVAEDEVAVTYIAAQFLDAMSAAVALLGQGRIRASMSQLRAMIESYVVVESVRGHPERGRVWQKAETPAERLQFSFEATYRESSQPPDMWKQLWDMCNEKVHTNSAAFPVQSRLRAVYGGDTWIGPFYEPASIANLFLMTLGFGQWFAALLLEWYGEHPLFPADFESRLTEINAGWDEFSETLQERATAEGEALKGDVGTLPLDEQLTARATFEAFKEGQSEETR